ncbi:hypothetical protein Hanom_Chr17g01581101 [Helianthus anomalus]
MMKALLMYVFTLVCILHSFVIEFHMFEVLLFTCCKLRILLGNSLANVKRFQGFFFQNILSHVRQKDAA